MRDAPHPRKLYGRRKGWKLGPHQQSLMETLLPRITVHPQPGRDPRLYFEGETTNSPPPCGEVASASARAGGGSASPSAPHPTQLAALAASTSPQGGGGLRIREVWLEVGFGGGEHLLWQAQHHPDVGVIGAEPFIAGIAKLLSSISPAGKEVASMSGNLLLYPGDAADVIEALPDASLGRVFVLFPDPWPKARHHKRRFLQSEMLDRFAHVLRSGAELRFATDDPGYLVWALERLMAHRAFTWAAQSPSDWRARPSDWPQTRYEQKALHGKPVYFTFVRV